MIKVAFLLGGFQNGGGIGRVTSIIANALSKDDRFEIHTISYFKDFSKGNVYVLDKDVKEHYLYDNLFSMKKALFLKGIIKNIKSILNEYKIDYLICCDSVFFVCGVLACKHLNTKCLCWEHCAPTIKSDFKFQNFSRMFGFKHCDRYIVLTKTAKDFFIKKSKKHCKKIVQIYNPVSQELSINGTYDKNSKKIISVGRLGYQKNFERLIPIAEKVLKANPDWEWHIFGEGSHRDAIHNLIKEFHLENKVLLLGHDKEIYSKYKNYSMMVMTSRYEGFPMSLLEASANGLPLISFDIETGPSEIIKTGINGFLIDKDDDEAMVERINELILNVKKRCEMSCESIKRLEEFSMERITEKWKALFLEMIR